MLIAARQEHSMLMTTDPVRSMLDDSRASGNSSNTSMQDAEAPGLPCMHEETACEVYFRLILPV
jgi:hypothetical protein